MGNIDSVGRLGGPYYTSLDPLDVEPTNFDPCEGPTPPDSRLVTRAGD